MATLETSLPHDLRWIATLCNATYFTPCGRHEHVLGKEPEKGELTNFFSRETGETLCPTCVGGRDVVQIRRSSYHNVVRVRDICRLFDARFIQTYVINGARVVFLNERPHPRGSGNKKTHAANGFAEVPSNLKQNGERSTSPRSQCTFCHRTLQSDTSLFCSIYCKGRAAGTDLAPNETAAVALEREETRGGSSAGGKTAGGKKQKEPPPSVSKYSPNGGGTPVTPANGGGGDGRAFSRLQSGSVGAAKSAQVAALGWRKVFGTVSPLDGGEETGDWHDTDADTESYHPAGGTGVKRGRGEPVPSSPLGFPELEDGDATYDPHVKTKKEKKFTKATPVPKPVPVAVAVSNSRRKNRPKKAPDN